MIGTHHPSARRPPLRRVRPALQIFKRTLYRQLNLSPMRRVIKELKRRNVKLHELSALEMFGGTGDYSVGVCHMRDYRQEVATVDAWEVRHDHGERLRRNLPWLHVEIGDAHRKVVETERKYGFVVVDNPEIPYAQYCEHFDLFPNILRIVTDPAILILNVMPETNEVFARMYAGIFSPPHLTRRQLFYQTDHPEKVPLAEMVRVYRDVLADAGFELEWCFWQNRNLRLDLLLGSIFPPMYYLVLKIRRRHRAASDPGTATASPRPVTLVDGHR